VKCAANRTGGLAVDSVRRVSCLNLCLNLGPNLGRKIAAAGLLPLRKTVQNDDFGAPRGAPSGCGERPPDKRPWKGTPCCGL
jgi:hypothetical protein